MAGPIRISILANASKAKSEISGFKREVQGLGGVLKKAAAFTGGYLLARGAVGGLKSIVSAASDAQQSIGGTEAVFGKYAGAVERDSKRAARAYGLSANTYREGANVIGALLKNQGVAQDKLGGKTKQLIGLASDLAATYGGKTSDAVEALTSAFKGEFDPLDRYGISLKQSTINAEAFRVANVKSQTEFNKLSTAQQRAAQRQATTNILFKQSKDAQGQFAKQTGTLAEKQQILSARLDNVKVKLGNLVLPIMSKAADVADRKLVPALDRFSGWLTDHKQDIADAGNEIKDTLLPPLKAAADLARAATSFISGLPLPIKRLGLESAVAAIGVAKFLPVLNATKGDLGGWISKVRDGETRAKALGGAARQAAGVGGLLLLTEGARKSGTAIGTLSTIAGGAATGFAVGGPWGAAIGAAGGALGVLLKSVRKTSTSFAATKQDVTDYAGSLDQVTGAATKATRALVLMKLSKSGALKTGLESGVSQRTLIDATLGKPAAIAQVSAAIDVLKGKVKSLQDQQAGTSATVATRNVGRGAAGFMSNKDYTDLGKAVDSTKGKVAGLTSVIGSQAAALRKSQSETRLAYAATANLKKLLVGFPKAAVTKIKADGVEHSMDAVRNLARQYKLTPKQVVTTARLAGFDLTLKQGRNLVKNLTTSGKAASTGVNKGLKESGKTKGDFTRYFSSITSATKTARGKASSGGRGVGADLKNGTLAGIGGLATLLSGQLAGAVNAAIAAGRRAADAHSPSRKTERLGKDMADGLSKGLKKRQARVVAQAKVLANKIRDAIAKVTDLKNQAATYAAGVRDSLVSFGDVTGFLASDQPLSSTTVAGSIVDSLKAKVDQAKQYADLITTLTKAKLNKSAIQQLIDAGVSGGLATAQAIATGGKDTIKQINELQGQLTSTGQSLGNLTAHTMYDAGIQTAQGLVDGLKAKEPALLKQASKLGHGIAAQVKKALGIKSPSRVFRQIGINTTKGLQVGLDVPDLRRSGRALASQLVDGFALPTLNADATLGRSGSAFTATVKLTAQQLSAIQRGREIQLDLNAYNSRGGTAA